MTAESVTKLRAKSNALGLYIHVPFCAKQCEFCAFYKEKADRTKIDLYMEAIIEELEKFPPGRGVETVFMGGGTPTLLTAGDLERLCHAVRTATGNDLTEWTIECAPGTLNKDKIYILKKWGVTRFSLGVQSFNEKTLAAIGRPHSLKQVEESIVLLRDNAKNWNIDLIFAAAESALPDWTEDLEKAVSLGSNHISTYCLTFESDTELYLKMIKGAKKRPSADEEALFYKRTWEFLRGTGFHHYEVANFARQGFECRHNLNTWRMQEWLGYGPAAASQFNRRRHSNIPDLEQWATGVKSGRRVLVDETYLGQKELALDSLVFGLRMPEGTDTRELRGLLGPVETEKLQEIGDDLCKDGLLAIDKTIWRLTDDGLLLADRIGAELLEITEKTKNNHRHIPPAARQSSKQGTL